MAKLINSQIHPNQETENDNSPDKDPSEIASPKLKLVVLNPDTMGNSALSQEAPSAESSINNPSFFTAEVRVKGPYLYEMAIHDPAHYLKCDLILEVEQDRDGEGSGSVICHFPTISDKELNRFVEEDETLYGMLMIQFQIQILEQLLLFCATHCASTLVIFADDDQADALNVYQDFLTYKDQTLTSKGEKTEMVIPADQETFNTWIDFMAEMTTDFHQTLWRDQSFNPIIRRYLKIQCSQVSPHEEDDTHNAR